MTTARDSILGNIRKSLGKNELSESPEVAARLAAHRANTIPARVSAANADLLAVFVEEAERSAATTSRISHLDGLADAVATYLDGIDEAPVVRIAPHPILKESLAKQSRLKITEGPSDGTDAVSLTVAVAGIAETGTLVLHSGPDSPTTLNFLPDTNIVLLLQSRIVGAYEDAWAVMRGGEETDMPRAINWITGPSRSADIEQTLLMGAHGPRRLHIVMLDDKETR